MLVFSRTHGTFDRVLSRIAAVFRYFILVFSGLMSVVLFVHSAFAQAPWRVADIERAGQWTIYNRTANGSLLGLPVALGDLDGDELADAVLSPMNADSGPGRIRRGAGEISVVMSSGNVSGELAGETNLASVDPADLPDSVALVYGRDVNDLLGTETFVADVDGDGFADIIAGAQLGDGPANGRPGSGEVAIVWGQENFGGRVIDTANAGADVTFVYGADAGDRLGVWVFAGDLDGDGTMDAILGADQGNGPDNDRMHVGETHVLYGGSHLRVPEIDLRNTSLARTVVYGIDDEDHSGTTVRAGDLDGDGTNELLIGAGLNRLSASIGNDGGGGHASRGGDGPNGMRSNAGEAYALYLGKDARPASIDLRDPPASTVFIYGIDTGDSYGEELFVGDFNGDGFGEIAIGAIVGDGPNNTRPNGGELALIMGSDELPGSVIDLATPPPGVTFFFGRSRGAIAGDTAMFADADGDGLDDLIIASPNEPVDGDARVGTTHIFFGTEDALPPTVDLAAIPDEIPVLLIEGHSGNDMLAYSMGAGDADGDGVVDIILNVMDGDGLEDTLESSGDAHVLSGAALAIAAGRGGDRCVGDCDGDGRVAIGEIIAAVRIALGLDPVGSCDAADANGDGEVRIAELIQAVAAALNGCRIESGFTS